MTFSAVFSKALEVLGAWILLSGVFGLGWVVCAMAARWRVEDSAALPHECRFPPAPRPHGKRYLRGYWTPDGRLTTLAGSPQVTAHMAFTDGELLAARLRAGKVPISGDQTLAMRESTVTAIAYLTKKDRTRADRACLRMAARLN